VIIFNEVNKLQKDFT